MNQNMGEASSFVIAQWIFLKLLLLNYLVAFVSLAVQVKGLYGKKGITPINETLDYLRRSSDPYPFLQFPSLFWLNASDLMLEVTAWIGAGIALLGFIGMGPAPLIFFLLWVGYLSFLTLGSEFLSFQWDILLVEVGFVSVFFAMQSPPPVMLLLVLWVILFRLIFASGVVKLNASTPEWRRLEAMRYHYETQPLPNKIAYYIHRLPVSWARFSVVATLILETAVPFLIFGPADMRLIAFVLLVGFQILILLTGNYAFFNWLTIALCVLLLDDWIWQGLGIMGIESNQVPSFPLQLILNGVGIILLFFNSIQILALFNRGPFVQRLIHVISPCYLVNSYGLFANMTTYRPEIIVEGSDDGIEWKPYIFKWKPDDLFKSPKQVAPHQPRLDWQLWFAALGHYYYNPWFLNFLTRLLEGSESVIQLLKTNPFPHHPPRLIRALLYDYHFSSLKTKAETGQWWTRKFIKVYLPTLTLKKKDLEG